VLWAFTDVTKGIINEGTELAYLPATRGVGDEGVEEGVIFSDGGDFWGENPWVFQKGAVEGDPSLRGEEEGELFAVTFVGDFVSSEDGSLVCSELVERGVEGGRRRPEGFKVGLKVGVVEDVGFEGRVGFFDGCIVKTEGDWDVNVGRVGVGEGIVHDVGNGALDSEVSVGVRDVNSIKSCGPGEVVGIGGAEVVGVVVVGDITERETLKETPPLGSFVFVGVGG